MCNTFLTFHTFFAFLTFFIYLKFFTYFIFFYQTFLQDFASLNLLKLAKSCKNVLYKNGKKCVTHSSHSIHSSHSSHSSHTLHSLHILFFPSNVFARSCKFKPVKTCKILQKHFIQKW